MKGTLRGTKGSRAHCWDKEWRNGGEKIIVAQDTGSAQGPRTKRTASWETEETPNTCSGTTTIHCTKTRQMKNQAVPATAHPRRHHQHRLLKTEPPLDDQANLPPERKGGERRDVCAVPATERRSGKRPERYAGCSPSFRKPFTRPKDGVSKR